MSTQSFNNGDAVTSWPDVVRLTASVHTPKNSLNNAVGSGEDRQGEQVRKMLHIQIGMRVIIIIKRDSR